MINLPPTSLVVVVIEASASLQRFSSHVIITSVRWLSKRDVVEILKVVVSGECLEMIYIEFLV